MRIEIHHDPSDGWFIRAISEPGDTRRVGLKSTMREHIMSPALTLDPLSCGGASSTKLARRYIRTATAISAHGASDTTVEQVLELLTAIRTIRPRMHIRRMSWDGAA